MCSSDMNRTATVSNFGVSLVDFNNIEDVVAYTHLLLMMAQTGGNLTFDGHKSDENEHRVTEEAKFMATRIEDLLQCCKAKDVQVLLEFYDIAYRIGFRKKSSQDFVKRQEERAFHAWLAGDKEIEESQIISMLQPKVLFSRNSVAASQIKAYEDIIGRWVETLMKCDCFPNTTADENFHRLAIVMRTNLSRFIGSGEIDEKRHWYDCNRVNDISSLSTRMLRSYRRFNSSLYPYIMDFNENIAVDCIILEELGKRTDMNLYDREAFRLALAMSQQMSVKAN